MTIIDVVWDNVTPCRVNAGILEVADDNAAVVIAPWVEIAHCHEV